MWGKINILIGFLSLVNGRLEIEINNPNPALDRDLYTEVLDAELCEQQLDVLKDNLLLLMQFSDAGLKLPRGITAGNLMDLGNYHQCLGIRHESEGSEIQGKYCLIRVPSNQNLELPWNREWSGLDPNSLVVDDGIVRQVNEYNIRREEIMTALGMRSNIISRSMADDAEMSLDFVMASCIPKPCTTQEAISSLFFNVSAIGFQYDDLYCRLSDDKPWSPADSVAVVIFAILGCLTILSTSFDLYNTVYKKGSKPNPLYTSFSVHTNGRRLMSFSAPPGTLHCVDGIRALAMAWVVVGHSFGSENFIANPIDSMMWQVSRNALWISAAPITVDTFFCLAGLVLVYSTVGKMSGKQLIKSLPLFYLNRLLRLFPVLAAGVLLQASFFNRMSDGPVWSMVSSQTDYCRTTWWLTLLHVQNYINPTMMCLPQSWYVAIDVHLYLVSPLILFWVLGRSRALAWTALAAGLLVTLAGAGVYNFINNFPSGIIQPSRIDELFDYMVYYYFNTLTRASPFFVGMIFGYVLHVLRGKKLQLSWMTAATLWAVAAAVSTTIFFYPSFISDMDWDNQLVDNIMNTLMRPAWSAALCWMIVACTHGYGGPVNWFLTLDMWKLPARISYAIFIFHYPLMFVVNSSALAPIYFTVPRFMFKFLAHLLLSFVVSYAVTLLIDSPFSTIVKLLLSGKKKKPVASALPTKADQKETEINNEAKLYDENERSRKNDDHEPSGITENTQSDNVNDDLEEVTDKSKEINGTS